MTFIGFNHTGGGSKDVAVVDDATPPLDSSNQGVVIAAPLTSGSHPNSNAPGRRKEDDVNLVSYALNAKKGYRDGDADTTYVTHALTGEGHDASEDGTGRGTPMAVAGASVRRLTPTECERLQGFPDGWTQLGGTPDSRRYAALGDAVTVNVARWIGGRLINA